ncbi:hypothetical protein M758_10G115700 [Ceratodon purpureus]|nr:hypothetical protein M758_10G115700 [Ceratodon purpureus]
MGLPSFWHSMGMDIFNPKQLNLPDQSTTQKCALGVVGYDRAKILRRPKMPPPVQSKTLTEPSNTDIGGCTGMGQHHYSTIAIRLGMQDLDPQRCPILASFTRFPETPHCQKRHP